MERSETIGFRVRTLSVAIKRAVEASKLRADEDGCTGTHGWVIGYLYENRHRDIYQRDIEKQFSVRKSTMTAILQLMEKNGLIERMHDEKDARLKKIVLTPLALDIHEKHEKGIALFEKELREGIDEEEMKIFLSVAEKILKNADRAEKDHIFGAAMETEE